MDDPLGRAAFEHAPCQMAVIGCDLRILHNNAAFARLFGEAEGKLCYRVLKNRELACDACPVLRVFDDGQPHSTEAQGCDSDGQHVCFSAHAVPLQGASGKVERVLHMAVDRTRLSQLEQGMAQAERLAAVGLTVAGLAHTIKNILAGLEGGIYVVDSGLKKDNSERVGLGWEMVKQYIEQTTALVKNLLRYSRAEQAEQKQMDPAELAADVQKLYVGKAELSGVALDLELSDDLPALSMDVEGMHAALTNLVTNAVDACMWDPDGDDKGGHKVVIAVRRDGDQILFEVRDNGVGISEENQAKILSAFFTTKGIRGTGLGLLLTKKTAKAHGGSVSFESTLGQGTTFRIRLPAPEADAQST